MTTQYWISAALMTLLALPGWARAEGEKPTVNTHGWAIVEKMPETLRLKIEIPANGPDVKQALAKLKTKREAAAKKLKDLGVADSAISFDGPKLSEDPADAMRKRMARMGGPRNQPDEAQEEGKKPSKVTVAGVLQAEWPVKAENVESLLVFASDMQDKIKAADLAGLKEEKPSEEEEEKLAEARERFGGYDSKRIPPGEPVILYVCKISDAESNKLLADAFAKAKTQATQLAAVAGMQLDSLSNIASSMGGPGEDIGMRMGYGSENYQMLQRMRAYMTPDKMEKDKEAIGVEPKKIIHGASITLTYKLK